MMQRILKIRSLLRALGLACALTSGLVYADVQALRFYEDAIGRFNAGDAKGALIQLRNSLQRDPTQLPARVLMGKILLETGAAAAAEEELDKAVKLGADPALVALPLAQARNLLGKHALVVEQLRPPAYPRSVQADLWVELAKARYRTGDRAGAEIALDEATANEPHHEQALLTRATIAIDQGEYAKAAELIELVRARSPDRAEPWVLLGAVRHAQGAHDEAVELFRQALSLAPGNARARLGEALALLDAGHTEQAAELFKGMRSDMPLSLEPHFFHAKALSRLGDDAAAGEALAQAAQLVNSVTPGDLGDDRRQLRLAASVKLGVGEYEGAYGFLARYLELEPGDSWATKQLARLLVRLNKPGDALRLLVRLRTAKPDDPQILVMLGDVNTALGDYVAAERYYQFALEQVEATPELVSRIGLNQLRQGRADAAIDAFSGIVGESPLEYPGASVFLGVLYLSEGRVKDAAAIADQVVAGDPGNLVARNLRAVIAIAEGDQEHGRTLLEQVVESHPDFQPAQVNLVKLDILQGRLDQAEQRLEELLRRTPDDGSALREAARLAALRGDSAGAVSRLERIREVAPGAIKPLTELTRLYLQAGENPKALEVAVALERGAPSSVAAKTNLARVQLVLGEQVLAQSLLLDAARLAGTRSQELIAVARLQRQAGAVEEAEKNLKKVLALGPAATAARRELAALMLQQGRRAEAIEELVAALESAPADAGLLTTLADTRLADGQTAEAIRLYEEARALNDTQEVMVRLHRALKLEGQGERAFEELLAWNGRNPEQPLVMRALADEFHARGRAPEALELYRRLTELTPGSVIAHNNLANLLLPVDGEKALRSALRAHELAPDNASVIDTLGWTLVQLGELERGLAYLREAVARNSRSPTLRYHLAVALNEYGNKAEARSELERALDLSGPFPQRDQALRLLQRLDASG